MILLSSLLGTSDHVAPPTDSSVTQSKSDSNNSNQAIVNGTKAINQQLKIIVKQNQYEFEFPVEDNIFIIDFIIKCEGFWTGIHHKFRLNIPLNYPFTFPTVHCLESERSYHPNIQKSDGSICSNILSTEGWKAMYTLTDICTALSAMFLTPNWEHSLNQDVFISYHDNRPDFFHKLRLLGALNNEISLSYSTAISEEHSPKSAVEGTTNSKEKKMSTRASKIKSILPSVSMISDIFVSKKKGTADFVEGVTGINISDSKSIKDDNHDKEDKDDKNKNKNKKENSLPTSSSSWFKSEQIRNEKNKLTSEYCELSSISETYSMVRIELQTHRYLF